MTQIINIGRVNMFFYAACSTVYNTCGGCIFSPLGIAFGLSAKTVVHLAILKIEY